MIKYRKKIFNRNLLQHSYRGMIFNWNALQHTCRGKISTNYNTHIVAGQGHWTHYSMHTCVFYMSVGRYVRHYSGRVTRSSGLAKTILKRTVQGGRRRGRQRKQWEDNIKVWTGLEWNIIPWRPENSQEWRKLVVESTVVPQRSAKLWYR